MEDGDDDFDAFVRNTSGRMMTAARLLVGSRDQAEDLVQEAYARRVPRTLKKGQDVAVTSPGRLPASPAMVAVRNAANWINLSTPIGLLVATIGGARVRRGPRGLFLADGYRWHFPKGGAFTIGNVVCTRHADVDALIAGRPGLLEHEESHSWQWTMCAGLPFLPIYLSQVAWSLWRHGDPATGNFFERQADLVDGGYVERP